MTRAVFRGGPLASESFLPRCRSHGTPSPPRGRAGPDCTGSRPVRRRRSRPSGFQDRRAGPLSLNHHGIRRRPLATVTRPLFLPPVPSWELRCHGSAPRTKPEPARRFRSVAYPQDLTPIEPVPRRPPNPTAPLQNQPRHTNHRLCPVARCSGPVTVLHFWSNAVAVAATRDCQTMAMRARCDESIAKTGET
jgi:hypothetical protein